MNAKEKELYQKKMQAQLDELKAELDQLKARAEGSTAGVQLDMRGSIKDLEARIEDGRKQLAGLAGASGDALRSLTDGLESSWGTMRKAVEDAASQFRR